MQRCYRHQFEEAIGSCDDCGAPGCHTCVVEVPRVGSMCVQCALARAGVRSRGRVQRVA